MLVVHSHSWDVSRRAGGAQVYAATWFQTKVAVKYLTKEGGEAEKEFLNEIKVMAESFHQNIVTFYSACMEPHRVRNAPARLPASRTPRLHGTGTRAL